VRLLQTEERASARQTHMKEGASEREGACETAAATATAVVVAVTAPTTAM
jgi:hypothetical protein